MVHTYNTHTYNTHGTHIHTHTYNTHTNRHAHTRSSTRTRMVHVYNIHKQCICCTHTFFDTHTSHLRVCQTQGHGTHIQHTQTDMHRHILQRNAHIHSASHTRMLHVKNIYTLYTMYMLHFVVHTRLICVCVNSQGIVFVHRPPLTNGHEQTHFSAHTSICVCAKFKGMVYIRNTYRSTHVHA